MLELSITPSNTHFDGIGTVFLNPTTNISVIFGSIGQLHHVYTDLQICSIDLVSVQKVQKYVLVSGKNDENA